MKLDLAAGQGKQRMILAHADIIARMHLGPTLPNDNVARHDRLAAELLYAEPASNRIAAVP